MQRWVKKDHSNCRNCPATSFCPFLQDTLLATKNQIVGPHWSSLSLPFHICGVRVHHWWKITSHHLTPPVRSQRIRLHFCKALKSTLERHCQLRTFPLSTNASLLTQSAQLSSGIFAPWRPEAVNISLSIQRKHDWNTNRAVRAWRFRVSWKTFWITFMCVSFLVKFDCRLHWFVSSQIAVPMAAVDVGNCSGLRMHKQSQMDTTTVRFHKMLFWNYNAFSHPILEADATA